MHFRHLLLIPDRSAGKFSYMCQTCSSYQKGFTKQAFIYQRVEDVENQVGAIQRVHIIQVYKTLSRVSFQSIPFTHCHVLSPPPPMPTALNQKGPVQDNPPFQLWFLQYQVLEQYSNTHFNTSFLEPLLLRGASPTFTSISVSFQPGQAEVCRDQENNTQQCKL